MDYFKDYLTPAMMFVGKFDATKNDYRIGDVCIFDNDKTCIYTESNEWYEIEEPCSRTEITIKEIEMLPKICSRCGAPLRYHVCEYCGTRY